MRETRLLVLLASALVCARVSGFVGSHAPRAVPGRCAPLRAAQQPFDNGGADGGGQQEEWFMDLDIREKAFDGEDDAVEMPVTAVADADGWVEPTGDEDEEGVVSVREFLPELMRI
eukprot:438390-Prymnesium_polylepis.1